MATVGLAGAQTVKALGDASAAVDSKTALVTSRDSPGGIDAEATQSHLLGEDCYPRVAINALLRVLQDPGLNFAYLVIQAIMYVLALTTSISLYIYVKEQ